MGETNIIGVDDCFLARWYSLTIFSSCDKLFTENVYEKSGAEGRTRSITYLITWLYGAWRSTAGHGRKNCSRVKIQLLYLQWKVYKVLIVKILSLLLMSSMDCRYTWNGSHIICTLQIRSFSLRVRLSIRPN